MNSQRFLASSSILLTLFLVGAMLMGFEMLGTRYLNPYFGSGINTWACLISVVLIAMMVGYMGGGYIVDRLPRPDLLAYSSILAGVSILIVPPIADPMLQTLVENFGDGFWSILASAMALTFIPVMLLSACSPFAVRLLLDDLSLSGRITGLVYSISTLGNVVGTLGTTYLLIPMFGVRSITIGFGVILLLIGLVFWIFTRRATKAFGFGCIAFSIALACSSIFADIDATAGPSSKRIASFYPEGPLWQGNDLLVAEMAKDRILRVRDGGTSIFWVRHGCGPTAVSQFRSKFFAVLCHQSRSVAIVSSAGSLVTELARTPSGERFNNPNDAISDGSGGLFFSDPGLFHAHAPAIGQVYHLSAEGKLRSIIAGLRYPNGVAYDPEQRLLYVSEHLRRRVLELTLDARLSVKSRRVILNVAPLLKAWAVDYPEAGPDGIELDGGSILVAIYGAARLVSIGETGALRSMAVSPPFVTNVAVSSDKIAVVGAFSNTVPPFHGRIEVWRRSQLYERMQ